MLNVTLFRPRTVDSLQWWRTGRQSSTASGLLLHYVVLQIPSCFRDSSDASRTQKPIRMCGETSLYRDEITSKPSSGRFSALQIFGERLKVLELKIYFRKIYYEKCFGLISDDEACLLSLVADWTDLGFLTEAGRDSAKNPAAVVLLSNTQNDTTLFLN